VAGITLVVGFNNRSRIRDTLGMATGTVIYDSVDMLVVDV
jgi:hypothetical protein